MKSLKLLEDVGEDTSRLRFLVSLADTDNSGCIFDIVLITLV